MKTAPPGAVFTSSPEKSLPRTRHESWRWCRFLGGQGVDQLDDGQRQVVTTTLGALPRLVDQDFTALARGIVGHQRAEFQFVEIAPQTVRTKHEGIAGEQLGGFVE